MITGNKGEWSEIYTLFKLLGDGKVHAGDAEMNKLPLYYPILNVIRRESQLHEYQPYSDRQIVVIKEDGQEVARLSMKRFLDESKKLLKDIKTGKGKGAFEIPSTERFMNEVLCEQLKAKSTDKADIHIVIHDLRTNMTPTLGFSIKSQLGSASTLLNAGTTTNVRYRIVGKLMDEFDAGSVNAVEEHLPRIDKLYKKGYRLEFDCIKHDTFRNNLLFIDANLPQLVAECLIEDSLGAASLKDTVEAVAKRNPFNYPGSNVLAYYEHKFKQLLISSALGMIPSKEWTGRFDANGGYLVVRKDGEIVCYHFYNQNDVEDYLYNNTRFERASRDRYDFGHVYRMGEGQQYYLDLNLQIRFKK